MNVEGVSKVTGNLIWLRQQYPIIIEQKNKRNLELLHNFAMYDLKSKSAIHAATKSFPYSNVGKSVDQTIESSKIIKTQTMTRSLVVSSLEYTSPHSAIVELGNPGGIIHSTGYGHKKWPIGKQQGAITAMKEAVPIQVGYHFLGSQFNSPTWKQVIKRSYKNIADEIFP